MKLRVLFAILAALAFTACQEKEYPVDVPVYTDVDNLVIIDTATTHIGGEYTLKSMSNFTYGIKGMQYGDEVKLRYKATGDLIAWQWGYKYLGILTGQETAEDSARLLISNGRKYEPDTITMGYSTTDQWQLGEWELLVCRGDKSQPLGLFDYSILKLDSLNTSTVNSGIIEIFADGWLNTLPNDGTDPVVVDSLCFVNAETKETVYTMLSPGIDTDNANKAVKVSFEQNLDTLNTGTYILQISRWRDDLKQDLGKFDFFSFRFVEPTFTKNGGVYYINITFDKIDVGDVYWVLYNDGIGAWEDEFIADNFDSEQHIYKIPIPEEHLIDGESYEVEIDKADGQIIYIKGKVTLNMEEVK